MAVAAQDANAAAQPPARGPPRKPQEQVWVKKGSGGGAGAAGAAASQQRAEEEPQVYSRSLLLKVMEKRAQEAQPRHRTPSTTATEESDGSEDQLGAGRLVRLTLAPAPEQPPPEPPQSNRRARKEQVRGKKVAAAMSAVGPGGPLHAEAPEFVPPWMFQPGIRLDVVQTDPGLGGPLPAAAAAVHFAAVEAAERAAARARAARAAAVDPGELEAGSAEAKAAEAKKQIEYYFSVRNVSHDFYLRSLMDKEGWVSLKEITNFPKIRALSVDVAKAAAVLENSPSVQLSQDRQSVRIASEAIRQAFPQADATAKAPTQVVAWA